jgi:multidrug efflux pump
VEGVKELTAYAAEGSATLVVEFSADFDPDPALIDVREAVDRGKVKIPSTAEEPIVSEVTAADFPILTINFSGEGVSERVLYNTALRVKDELEAIPDIMEANLRGQREEVLEAVIDPARLESFGIDHPGQQRLPEQSPHPRGRSGCEPGTLLREGAGHH